MNSKNNKHDNAAVKSGEDFVIEKEDGFDIDWNSIEQDIHKHRRHRHHHHKQLPADSERNSGNDKQVGTKLKHTVNIVETVDHKKKKPLWLKIILALVIFFLCLVIGVTIAFFIIRYQGQQQLLSRNDINIDTIDGATTDNNGQTISYNGKTYKFNPYVTSILFMGIDKEELKLEDNLVGTGGQADAIYLLTYDTSKGVSKLIAFSRDTMVDINTYYTNGNYAGVENAQLCLSYAYGDGKDLSARNVVTSLQRIIFNVPINSYFAMDLSAIKVINDDIGGVTLNSLFTYGDFQEGKTVTLTGDMAESYVRTRDISILDSNVGRMERQKQYITAFANQFMPAIKKDFTVPISIYNDAKDYVTTNLTGSKITFLASSVASNYSGINIITVPGEIKAGSKDGKAQFIPDQNKLFQIVLDTFYTAQ